MINWLLQELNFLAMSFFLELGNIACLVYSEKKGVGIGCLTSNQVDKWVVHDMFCSKWNEEKDD